jgi:hypothetical protein
MSRLLPKYYFNKRKRFLDEMNYLLGQKDCSEDTRLIFDIAKRKVENEKIYYSYCENFVQYNLGKINLSKDKKLSSIELKYFHILQGRAGGKGKGGGYGKSIYYDKYFEK